MNALAKMAASIFDASDDIHLIVSPTNSTKRYQAPTPARR